MLAWAYLSQSLAVSASSCAGSSPLHHMNRKSLDDQALLEQRQYTGTPIIITNKCEDTIYPGLLTQSGMGPGTGGFELTSGSSRTLSVGNAWQGRVWGRTNCSFNGAGTGPAERTNNGRACTTGDCGGIIDCKGTVGSRSVSVGAALKADFAVGRSPHDFGGMDSRYR